MHIDDAERQYCEICERRTLHVYVDGWLTCMKCWEGVSKYEKPERTSNANKK